MDYQTFLSKELQSTSEKEWIEYKFNNDHAKEIGEYISALANAAKLHRKSNAYIFWGVNDSREIVGTTFDPYTVKGKGNEDLIPWLVRQLDPQIHFEIEVVTIEDKRVVVFNITSSADRPVTFAGEAYIRVGSYKKPLKHYPEKARILWRQAGHSFEQEVAVDGLSQQEVTNFLNVKAYFDLIRDTPSTNTETIIERLIDEGFVTKKQSSFSITNLGVLVLANNLKDFDVTKRKNVRVITYKGINKLHSTKEQVGVKGYAVGFEGLIKYIETQIPNEEIFDKSIRKTVTSYPTIAIREFVANALVHQDFISGKGSTVLVEIFQDRIEITNPGIPLIETDRFIDHPPKSRNEHLSDMMRRMGICEERGSGIDRALVAIGMNKLPAPSFEQGDDFTKVTLYHYKPVSKMTLDEKMRVCYQHCCISWIVHREPMKNESLCERLGIEEKNKAIASRIIKEAREKGLIKPFDPESNTRKYAKYVPYWV